MFTKETELRTEYTFPQYKPTYQNCGVMDVFKDPEYWESLVLSLSMLFCMVSVPMLVIRWFIFA